METPDEETSDKETSDKTAFVLAGGGAKGAFEAGAVSYLVEEEGVVPDVITATSAGAICAAVLAQARGRQELVERTRELRDDLLAMTTADLLFGKQPWVAALDDTLFGRAIDYWFVESTRPALPAAPEGSLASGGRTGGRSAGGRSAGGRLAGGRSASGASTSGPSATGRSARRARPRSLRLAGQVLRALPRLGQARRRMQGRAGSLLTLDPLADRLRRGGRGIAPVDPALIARPGLELRISVVALGAGSLRYVTQDGTIVSQDAVTPLAGAASGPVDLIDAVIASASVPMVFPPRPLADDAYVDGGIIENIPVAAAAAVGARRIYALLAVPLDPPSDERDYAHASAPAVLLRAIGAISFAERQRANLNPRLPDGTELIVIDPVVDVIGPFEIARGLMLINMDYGWMRASDVTAGLDASAARRAAEATDAIVVARAQAWHCEEELWTPRPARPGRAADLAGLTRLKRVVRDALSERKALGLPFPHDATRWWSGYEVHEGARPAFLPSGFLEDRT